MKIKSSFVWLAALWLTSALPCHAGKIHDAVTNRDLTALELALKKEPKQLDARCYPDFVTPLYLAVAAGDPVIVKRLLDAGADPSIPAVAGATLMTPKERSLFFCGETDFSKILDGMAAQKLDAISSKTGLMKNRRAGLLRMPPVTADEKQARIQVLKLLYTEKPAHQKSNPPIHMAAAIGNTDALQLLLDSGADANASDEIWLKPLHHAVLGGADPAVIQLLISMGADVDAGDKIGITPLMYAAAMGDVGLVDTLLAAGGSPAAEDQNRLSVICYAATSGNDELVRLIHRKGGRDLIRYAKQERILLSAALGGSMALTELALAEGVNVDIRDEAGFTPMLTALEHGHRELATLLLNKGANPNAQTNSGDRMIDIACGTGNTELFVKLLASEKPDKAILTKMLTFASVKGRRDIVKLLIDKGADLNAQTGKTKMSPIGWVLTGGAYQEPNPAFNPPTKEERTEIIELLIQQGARADCKGGDGLGLLHTAALANGDEKIIQILLKAGAQPNVAAGPFDLTPLQIATKHGRIEIVRMLLDAGANLKTRDQQGNSLLHTAASGGSVEMLRFLIDKGLPVNDKSPIHGATPLHFAVIANAPECVQLLLAKGALTDVQDIAGCLPLIQAIEKKFGSEMFKTDQMLGSEQRKQAVHHVRNRLKIIHLLLAAGARTDVSLKSPEAGNFNSLKDYAKSYGSPEIVELFENPPPVTRKSRKP